MPNLIEVELRIFLKDRKKIEEELKNHGSKIICCSRIIDYWYCPKTAKNYKQASIDKTGFALRIRKTRDIYSGKSIASLECKTLCDKKNHAMCNEYEVDVRDVRQTRGILESIGLKEFLVIDKGRIIYKYKSAKFCFDKIKGLGNGLEIEILTKGNVKKVHARLEKMAQEMGIKQNEILKKSLTYLAMKKLSKF